MRLMSSAKWIYCSLLILFLAGCQSSLMKNLPANEIEEQLYINAELNFAIQHPLDWARKVIPVSSPMYSANTIYWQIGGPTEHSSSIGRMLLQSLPSGKDSLPDRLSHFLSEKPELRSGQTTQLKHPAGEALKLLGQDAKNRHLTLVIQGQQHDFIISLSYPKENFEELLPIFQQVVDSFSEIIRPDNDPKTPKS
jgi:hypothetical protein